MPAALGTAFNWVTVSGGVVTKIAQGPLIQGLPLQALELGRFGPGPSGPIAWTLTCYSAAPPFYSMISGTVTPGFFGAPPVGHTGFYAAVLAFHSSPWVDFNLLTSKVCFAHIAYL
jgi:hypothetical protein